MVKLLVAALILVIGGVFVFTVTQTSVLNELTSKASPVTPSPVAVVSQDSQNSVPSPTLSASDEDINADLTALDRDLSELDTLDKSLTNDINSL